MDSQPIGILKGIVEIYNSLFVDTKSYLLAIIFFAVGNMSRLITDRYLRKNYHKELRHFRELVSSEHLVTAISEATATIHNKQNLTSQANHATHKEHMIRHTVLFRVADAVDGVAIARVFAALKDLQHKINGIISISTGSDCSPEGMQRGYTHGFTVDFVDAAARDKYLPHPIHQALGQMIVDITEGGIAGICVVDWKC